MTLIQYFKIMISFRLTLTLISLWKLFSIISAVDRKSGVRTRQVTGISSTLKITTLWKTCFSQAVRRLRDKEITPNLSKQKWITRLRFKISFKDSLMMVSRSMLFSIATHFLSQGRVMILRKCLILNKSKSKTQQTTIKLMNNLKRKFEVEKALSLQSLMFPRKW